MVPSLVEVIPGDVVSLFNAHRKREREKRKNRNIFPRTADGEGTGREAGGRGWVVCVTVARGVDSFQGSPGNSCLQGRGLVSSWGDTDWDCPPTRELLFCLGNEEDSKESC